MKTAASSELPEETTLMIGYSVSVRLNFTATAPEKWSGCAVLHPTAVSRELVLMLILTDMDAGGCAHPEEIRTILS